MTQIPFEQGLMLAGLLFALGLLGVMVRRNLLFILMSVEIMLNASALAFVVAGARWGQPEGQVMVLFIMATAAAEASVGLALILQVHRLLHTLDADEANRLRG